MKRFWQDVTVTRAEGGYGIALNGRPVRTPGRAPLAVPSEALAEDIAEEWRAVTGEIDPRAMPLTGLANAAIDRIAIDRANFAAGLARYGETDLLCYRAGGPDELVARQRDLWEPHLEWARTRYDVHFERITGVMHRPQPEATVTRLADATATRDAFALAGLAPLVTITGSLVLGLALAESATDTDSAWAAANCDALWQEEHWGADSVATKQRADHRRDLETGMRFLTLLRG